MIKALSTELSFRFSGVLKTNQKRSTHGRGLVIYTGLRCANEAIA